MNNQFNNGNLNIQATGLVVHVDDVVVSSDEYYRLLQLARAQGQTMAEFNRDVLAAQLKFILATKGI